MNQSLGKIWAIARPLMWQQRWLFLLLLLWPFGITVLLVTNRGALDADDALAVLHQECFYGMALAAVTASTQLGNEQRSRRVLEVLARAVSRPLYLGALWTATWLPLVGYAAGFLINGLVVVARVPGVGAPSEIAWMAGSLLVAGAFGGTVGLLCSVYLSLVLSPLATLGVMGALSYFGSLGLGGPGAVLGALRGGAVSWGDLVATMAVGVAVFAAAAWIFRRRDLDLASG
jgi:hypothetical protein